VAIAALAGGDRHLAPNINVGQWAPSGAPARTRCTAPTCRLGDVARDPGLLSWERGAKFSVTSSLLFTVLIAPRAAIPLAETERSPPKRRARGPLSLAVGYVDGYRELPVLERSSIRGVLRATDKVLA